MTARGKRRGAAAVEAAIVLLPFLTFVLGMLDLGLAVSRWRLICEAARVGARQAVVHGSLAASPWGPSTIGPVAADDADPVAEAVQPYLVGLDPSAVQVQAVWIDGGNAPDQRVQVTVSTNYPLMLPSLVGATSVPLHAVSTMRIAH